MGEACDMYGREGFGGKARDKEMTWKTLAKMGEKYEYG